MPESAKSGRKTSNTMAVPKTMGLRISLDAVKTTSRTDSGRARCWFSRRRRKTFSTPTIASSTNSPMATAMPPRVIVLSDRPNQLNTSAVVSNDNGMAVSVIAVVRKFSRNKNSTITTRPAPMSSASCTFQIDASINCDWRKRLGSISRSSGNDDRRSFNAASIIFVSFLVSAPGCFCMAMMTAGRAFTEPSPRLVIAPSRTSATSRTRIGTCDRMATSDDSSSCSERIRPRFLTRSS